MRAGDIAVKGGIELEGIGGYPVENFCNLRSRWRKM